MNTNNALPAVAPPLTPEMAIDFMDKSRNALTIPYSLTNHPWTSNPAVATEDAVFYAVNPYWQVSSLPLLTLTHTVHTDTTRTIASSTAGPASN